MLNFFGHFDKFTPYTYLAILIMYTTSSATSKWCFDCPLISYLLSSFHTCTYYPSFHTYYPHSILIILIPYLLSSFHTYSPHSILTILIPYLLSSFHTYYPHSILTILIPYLLSSFHTYYPHSILTILIPYLLSSFHTYYPHSILTILIPYLLSSFHTYYPHSILGDSGRISLLRSCAGFLRIRRHGMWTSSSCGAGPCW